MELFPHQPESDLGANLTTDRQMLLGKYEAMAAESTPKKVFSALKEVPLVFDEDDQRRHWEHVRSRFERSGIDNWGVVFKGDENYPGQLAVAKDELQYFYYQGNLELLKEPMVAVVGSRRAMSKALEETRLLVKGLVEHGYTIVSGLAKGIDSMAHKAAIENSGKTVAVIGNPLWIHHPFENERLQRRIGEEHLLVSQVPVSLYSKHSSWDKERGTFLMKRNITMAALSKASIVMAVDSFRSGTYSHALNTLKMGLNLFVHDNVKLDIKFQDKHTVKVGTYQDVLENLVEKKGFTL